MLLVLLVPCVSSHSPLPLTIPISPTATMADVIGILGFALHAAHKVYTILESIKDAPSEIQALRDEAFQVHSFLETIQNSQDVGGRRVPLHVNDVQDSQIEALVKRAQHIEATFDKFISKVTTRKDNGTYEVKKLKWPLYAGEAKNLSEQFKAFYVSLTAVYTVSTSYVLRSCCTVRALSCTFDSVTVDAMSSDLRTQQATLAHYGGMLQEIHIFMTLHSAAREQREGHSMRFDEICARARSPPITTPRAETYAGPSAPNSQPPPRPSPVGPMENDGDPDGGPREFDVRAHALFCPIY